jgi:hypothetical protein
MRLKAKEEGNLALSELLKLLMNSTYGGFALHAPAFLAGVVEASSVEYLEKVHGVDLDITLDDKYHLVSYRKAPDFVLYQEIPDDDPAKESIDLVLNQIQNPNAFMPEVNVALAAEITAQGRILIRRKIKDIQDMGGLVGYSATDSVYTNLDLSKIDHFKNDIGNQLGQFKLERSADEAAFARCGLYGLIANPDAPFINKDGTTSNLILKHGGYNKGDISYDEVRHLALTGTAIQRTTRY